MIYSRYHARPHDRRTTSSSSSSSGSGSVSSTARNFDGSQVAPSHALTLEEDPLSLEAARCSVEEAGKFEKERLRGLWHDMGADFPYGGADFPYGGADFPYGGAANRAANREFSAAIRQSGPKNTKRTTPSRPAKTVRMAAVHYDVPFAEQQQIKQARQAPPPHN